MANFLVNSLLDKVFPTLSTGENENIELKQSFVSLRVNGGTDEAMSRVAERFVAAENGADAGDGAPKTVLDFYRKILKEQPFDFETLSKRKTSVVLETGKPSARTTLADYERAKNRAIFARAGYAMLSDADIETALTAIRSNGTVSNRNFGLENLRRTDEKPGAMFVGTDLATIEIAKRVGQAVLQYRAYEAKRLDAAIKRGQDYATDALGGFVQPAINAPVNIINGISEPFRAGERALFGTSRIPELPRMQIAERSEYWQKDGRFYINRGAEIGATIYLGGAVGGKAIVTQAGRALLGVEAGYNVGAGLAGKDITQTDAQGNARQMKWTERGLRVAGGLFGARQTVKTEISTPNSAVNKLDDIFKNTPSIKPQSEMVTPEGLRVKTNLDEVPENTFLSKAVTETSPVGRRNLDSHEGVSGFQEGKQIGHAILKHVGKSERWLQNRLLKETNTPSASSFYNKEVGNRTVGKFKKLYEEEINQWLKSKETEPFEATIDMEEGIGLVVNRNKKGTPLPAEEAAKAEIVLVKDNSEWGWHLFTVKLQK